MADMQSADCSIGAQLVQPRSLGLFSERPLGCGQRGIADYASSNPAHHTKKIKCKIKIEKQKHLEI
jgi:hypothetical protein